MLQKMRINRTALHREDGFTLIELLVVIAIIGILVTLVLVSLATAREKARDSRRKTDLQAVSSALELQASDNGDFYYCPSASGDAAAYSEVVAEIVAKDYLQEEVNDPSFPDSAYGYRVEGCGTNTFSGTGFELNASLENENDQSLLGGDDDTLYEVGSKIIGL